MLTKGPKVSVIITCYNQEVFIGQAIESVLHQSYQDWECWIIDDGSTDSSPAICSAFAAQDERIHFMRQQNAGVSAARNAGFIKAKGCYIQFLDGDDWILPEKLEKQVLFMEANPQYGVSYTDHQHYWQSSGNLANYSFEVLKEQPLEQFLFGYDRGVSIPIHSALLRRCIWKHNEVPFSTDYSHRYEDWVFWVLVAVKGTRFAFLNQPMAVYRMHPQNFVKNPKEMAANAIQAMYYISQIIPVKFRGDFQSSRLDFILARYSEQKKQTGEKRSWLLKLYQTILNGFTRKTIRLWHQVIKARKITVKSVL